LFVAVFTTEVPGVPAFPVTPELPWGLNTIILFDAMHLYTVL
jgi:hypothetical protein